MDDVIACERRHGPVVGGRYRLEQVLQCGPDRCVHRAHDVLLRRAITTVGAAQSDGEPVPEAATVPISARLPHGELGGRLRGEFMRADDWRRT